MRRIHLLRVAEEAQAFAPLLVAAAAAGLRVGWLELRSPPPLPESLRAALLAGGDRAVAVAADWTLSARPRKGPALMRELLRQQFLGCALVLVHGEVEAPLLAPSDAGGWNLSFPVAGERRLTSDQLLAGLRQARPFAPFQPVT